MSDGGSEAGRRALLLGDPSGPPERTREKETRAALESAKLRGGTAAGLKDLAPGTSASSPGSSKECAPETDTQSAGGEADYCRRILVRGKSRETPAPPHPTPPHPTPAAPRPRCLSRFRLTPNSPTLEDRARLRLPRAGLLRLLPGSSVRFCRASRLRRVRAGASSPCPAAAPPNSPPPSGSGRSPRTRTPQLQPRRPPSADQAAALLPAPLFHRPGSEEPLSRLVPLTLLPPQSPGSGCPEDVPARLAPPAASPFPRRKSRPSSLRVLRPPSQPSRAATLSPSSRAGRRRGSSQEVLPLSLMR
ncbi:hypothetical protein lerEdw1_019952 [Lerista edwardsae]|nr:hypothetical protein lerEdw1_019952 [Lerista edwardsae]